MATTGCRGRAIWTACWPPWRRPGPADPSLALGRTQAFGRRVLGRRAGAGGDQGVDAGLFGAERRQVPTGQDGALGHAGAARIGPLAVAPQLVVQVRAGRGAGRADIGDHLALADALAGAQPAGVTRQVGIAGFPAAGVADADPVAVAAPATGFDDHAVG